MSLSNFEIIRQKFDPTEAPTGFVAVLPFELKQSINFCQQCDYHEICLQSDGPTPCSPRRRKDGCFAVLKRKPK